MLAIILVVHFKIWIFKFKEQNSYTTIPVSSMMHGIREGRVGHLSRPRLSKAYIELLGFLKMSCKYLTFLKQGKLLIAKPDRPGGCSMQGREGTKEKLAAAAST